MKFGSIALTAAKGAILAHSMTLPSGKLRKGVVLSDDHIAQLHAAGIAEVTVAQLEPEDLHEDAAATALAQALVPDPNAQGLRLTHATTGRVNILADGPGVVRLRTDALVAMNAVDPMITVATVPDYQQMHSAGMVATVKVISYGVANSLVEQAAGLGSQSVWLKRPQIGTASLIITDIDGGPGDKGQAAIAGRLTALGVTLKETIVVPHTTQALAEAVAQVNGGLILILTASATSDAYDVAPQAVRDAGGTVTRFGMPVDPGNLLFLGARGATPVIGLPGCARSPALNGADWVLSRVVCGIEVTANDIAAMGVGGLLKEIPTRPMPRAGRKSGNTIE